jgi:hypothetical protein
MTMIGVKRLSLSRGISLFQINWRNCTAQLLDL